MLHGIYQKLEQQDSEMERQRLKIEEQERHRHALESQVADLQQKLEQVEPRLEQSEMEKDCVRRRSEAYRQQLIRRNRKDWSGPGVPIEHYRRPLPGGEEKIVISTEMIAEEKWAHRMAMTRADGLQNAPIPSQRLPLQVLHRGGGGGGGSQTR